MNNGAGNSIRFKPNLNQRRRNVGSTNSNQNRQQNQELHQQSRRENQQHNRPYFSDPLLLVRVSEYLRNLGRNAYINIDTMLQEFQREYPEYRRRQRGALKSHIIKAVDVVRFENSLVEEDDDSADDVIEDDSSDVVNVTENQSFTYALEGDGDVNTTLEDSYLQQNAKRRKTSDQDDQELIDIVSSSEEENKDESKNTPTKAKKTVSDLSKKKVLAVTPKEEMQVGKKRKTDLLEKSNKRFKGSLKPVQPSVSFKDIGGNEKVLNEVTKLLIHLLHPEVYRTLGVSPPRGFLLHGPPGSGKTLLANAIAGELKLPLLKVAAPELVGGLSGQSEERIRDLFEQAVALAPCILFIDEVDAITPNRENAHREMERRIVAQLLTSMDELANSEQGDQVLVIGATNRPDSLDPALRRAGRFDREVCLGIPDRKSRQSILRTLCLTLRLMPDLSLDDVAALTPGYVGADLKSLVTEAAMASVRRLFKDLSEKENRDVKNKEEKVKPLSETNSDQENKGESEQKQEAKSSNEEHKTEEEEEIIKIVDDVEVVDDRLASDKGEAMDIEITPVPAEKPEERQKGDEEMEHFLNQSLLRSAPLSAEQLQGVFITMDDFKAALTFVQPSAKREGFATVPDVKWEDIGSLQDIRQELQMSIMAPVKFPQEFARLGLQSPTGILLCGPPGCGKTLLAKAIANEAGINFISVKGPELLNMYVGESERAVRQCFQRARSSQPCVIFFDEIDALCPKRSGMENGASRVVNQLLTEMDGVEGRTGVYLMAATNRPDIVDPAVMRPGRLDKVLYVGLPNADDRADILRAMTKNGTQPRLAADVDLREVAEDSRCEGYTGADLGALVREASMESMKEYMGMTTELQATAKLEACSRHFSKALANIRPSVSNKDKLRYENLRLQYAAPPQTTVEPPIVTLRDSPSLEDARTSTEDPV